MSLLEIGDRFPNVLLRREGVTQALYNAAAGRAFLIGWDTDPRTRAALDDAAQSVGAEVLWLTGADGSAQSAGDRANLQGLAPSELLAPPELMARVRGIDCARGFLLLEPSMRVIARVDTVDIDPAQLRVVLRAALADSGIADAGSESNYAPVLVVPRVLEAELIARVLDWFREGGEGQDSGVVVHEQGTPVFRLDPAVKMRREARIEEPALDAELHDRLMRRVLPEIGRAFAFEVKQREAFKVLRYEAGGGYFRAHRDNDTRDVAHRRFAMTLNLNSGDYEGGRLRFPEFGPREYEAPSGGALVFSCSLLHEVTDLTAGTRYAMTSFFF